MPCATAQAQRRAPSTNTISSPGANEVQVSLDVFRVPFRNGKVALLGYIDVFRLADGDKWAADPRFTVRPDT